MLAAGIKSPVLLEELESHLREEIERQMNSGSDEQNAFEISTQQIGQPRSIKREFKKNEWNIMTRFTIIGFGIFGILFGTAVFLPALAKHNKMGIWNSDIILPMTIGAVITVVGIGSTVFGFKRRKV